MIKERKERKETHKASGTVTEAHFSRAREEVALVIFHCHYKLHNLSITATRDLDKAPNPQIQRDFSSCHSLASKCFIIN